MITYPFSYKRATNLAEAEALLAANPEAKLLAGGQTLIPTMKQRLANPSLLVDISGLRELSDIRSEGDRLVLGAAITHAEVARSADVRAAIPALAELASHIGDPAVRHLGTLGGSVANNDPAADYPAAVLGLNATLITARREIPADAFFTGMFETALEPDEILRAIAFPRPQRAAYAKFANPASRYAMVGVFVAQTAQGVRVAVTGAAPCVMRITAMERALDTRFSPEAISGITIAADGLNEDLHGSAEYRAHLVTVMASRAVKAALA
ncbi:MAG: xanthine dehydrogenase family protein subunit M [Alphaproteobacteria bacterium]|nr:xanthine dehydrogenase family protein subunit M [Alphaproteobacteria bacterium]